MPIKIISITYNPVIEFVKLNDPVHKHTKSMQSYTVLIFQILYSSLQFQVFTEFVFMITYCRTVLQKVITVLTICG